MFLLVCITVQIGQLYAQQSVVFPDEFNSSLAGKEIVITNPMYVIQTFYDDPYDNIYMSDELLPSPTDVVLPGTNDYYTMYSTQKEHSLKVVSSYSLGGAEKFLRVGAYTSQLKGKVSYSKGYYTLTLTEKPLLAGNERPAAPAALASANLKIVGFNLEFYMASPSNWDVSYGAKSASEFAKQRTKIGAALKGLDADIYSFCEVEEGNYSLRDLADLLNEVTSSNRYTYVDDGDSEVTTYTKNVFIYNKEKVKPYLNLKTYDGYLAKRHVAQCFEMLSNGERLIVSMNHLKSKGGSGKGENADQGDGQGQYNALRVSEANDCLTFFDELKLYYGDTDILVLGDLNAYSQEDPLQVFYNAGFTNELKRFSPTAYSYSYRGRVGNLDHALTTTSLTEQIAGATIWNINAAESDYFGYSNTSGYAANPYRCSDHNPVIVSLHLGSTADGVSTTTASPITFFKDAADANYQVMGPSIERVEVVDSMGRVVADYKNATSSTSVNVSTTNLQRGLYIVRVSTPVKDYAYKLLK